jgi:CheY-like chemotaxis protein
MGIQGNASLMLLEKEPADPDYERLRNIESYVRNGADLTKQLLGFAKGGKYEVKPLDINEIVRMSAQLFSRTKKEITIHTKYQEDVWSVEADPGQLEQVMLNLYVNAWQAMPGGGELLLETENVILDEKRVAPHTVSPGRYVRIAVTDTGVGMDEMTRQRIFDPFFTTKEMGRGTGLGLASVYGIIRNHGGFIIVESEKGHGSTFTIFLPFSEKAVRREEQRDSEIRKGEGTVLLVDDEEMIIDVGGHMLEKMGYRVFIARSGKEALDQYQKNKDDIDLVILDMIMPEMGGGETYDRLKAMDPAIKVLLSSGYSIDGQAGDIMERGCNGFIQKPFNMKDLSRRIRDILDL